MCCFVVSVFLGTFVFSPLRGPSEFLEEIESIVAALRGIGGAGTGGKIKVLDVPLKEILENGSVLSVNRYITDALQVKSLNESIRIFENAVNSLKLSLYQVSGAVDSGNFRALAQVKNQYDSECKMYPLNQIVSHIHRIGIRR